MEKQAAGVDQLQSAICSVLRAGVHSWLVGEDPEVLRRLCRVTKGYAGLYGGFLSRVDSVLDRSLPDAIEALRLAGRVSDADDLEEQTEACYLVSPSVVDELFRRIEECKDTTAVRRLGQDLGDISERIGRGDPGHLRSASVLEQLDALKAAIATNGDGGTAYFESISDASSIDDAEPPRVLVRDFFFEQTFVILGGDPKAGKSTLALQLALCVAGEVPFLGRRISRGGPVVLIQADMGAGYFRNTIQELAQGLGIGPLRHKIHYKCTTEINLQDASVRSNLLAEIKRLKPALVICDPMRDLHTGNEDKSDEIKPVLDFFLSVRDRTGAVVIAIDHLTKPAREGSATKGQPKGYRLRGSGSKYGRLDTSLIVSDQGQGLSLVEIKHRYGGDPGVVHFTREYPVPGERPFRLVEAGNIPLPQDEDTRERLLAFLGANRDYLTKTAICIGARVKKSGGLDELLLLEEQGLIEHDGEPTKKRKWRIKSE